MNVNFVTMTPNLEDTIVYIARVSSSREDKKAEAERLINYLIRNKHWSPFEHGYITFEIITSKAIGIQILRHRSFTFQEFSQRYQDINKLSNSELFETIELRKQATDNRQSSTEVFDPYLTSDLVRSNGTNLYPVRASEAITQFLLDAHFLYNELLKTGVARETARMVLPMTTKTRIFMTGSVRSWIHFLELRDDSHAQKEIQLIAKEIKKQLKEKIPVISSALNW